MSQNLRKFTQALYALNAVAQRVPDANWDRASCCEGWTAREVAGHASWVIQNIGAGAGQYEGPAQQAEAEVAGADPAATIAASIKLTMAALDQPDVLARVTETPFGEMPLDDFLGAVWVDPLTHAWDIADAAGIEHGIDQATAQEALDGLTPMGDTLRGLGAFGPEQQTQSADVVAKFIAFAGRQSVQG